MGSVLSAVRSGFTAVGRAVGVALPPGLRHLLDGAQPGHFPPTIVALECRHHWLIAAYPHASHMVAACLHNMHISRSVSLLLSIETMDPKSKYHCYLQYHSL